MMSQNAKLGSQSKQKKSSRDRDKRKSIPGHSESNCNSNTNQKPSPTRESHSKKCVGISTDSIKIAFEHIARKEDSLSENLCKVLTEDLNYKLRYIIHQASNRAFISNRTGISSTDIDETFIDLSFDKVYGAPPIPKWISDSKLLYLDDPEVNVMRETELELTFPPPAEPVITKAWLRETDEISTALKNYFRKISEALISNDIELRRMALQNVSSNPNIGPIIEWFYKFGYMLLSKSVTLTLYALDLIETLEMSPIGNAAVDENQLNLLVTLILQRIFIDTNPQVLRPLCWVLGILCRRYPLREFVITKLSQTLPKLQPLPLIMIANSIGIDAILAIFVNNIDFFSYATIFNSCYSPYGYSVMETYYLLYKNNIYHASLYNNFSEIRNFIVLLNSPFKITHTDKKQNKVDFISTMKELLRTRKKIFIRPDKQEKKVISIEKIFQVPLHKNRIREKLEYHNKTQQRWNVKKSHIIIGKSSVLLNNFKNKSAVLSKCEDHSLFFYNL